VTCLRSAGALVPSVPAELAATAAGRDAAKTDVSPESKHLIDATRKTHMMTSKHLICVLLTCLRRLYCRFRRRKAVQTSDDRVRPIFEARIWEEESRIVESSIRANVKHFSLDELESSRLTTTVVITEKVNRQRRLIYRPSAYSR